MSGTGQPNPPRNDPSSTSGGTAATNNVMQRQPSENFKKAQVNVKNAITRASSAGLKTSEDAQPFIDSPVDHDALELETIDKLRKKLIVIAGMIETDTHFFESIKNSSEILSSKERNGLREVAKAHLDLKPRTITLPIVKKTIKELQAVLEKQNYHIEAVSSTDAADISEIVANSPVDDEEQYVDNTIAQLNSINNHVAPSSQDEDNENRNNAQHHSSVGVANSGGTQVPPVVPPVISSNTGNHEASSLLLGTVPNSASSGLPISCPVCRGNHDLFDCESPKLTAYCARNGLCVLCMSTNHPSRQCPIREAGLSPIPSGAINEMHPDNGGRFITSCKPIIASTPRNHVQSNFSSLSDSERKEHAGSDRTLAPRTQNEISSEEETDDACRATERGRKMKSSNKGLSYYDLEAILPKFSGDALRYKKFISMFEKLGVENPRISDEMRLAILKKKLVGDAKRFYVDLSIPAQAIEATLAGLRTAFEGDTSGVTEALKRFRELTFHETDLKRSSRQLQEGKSLVLRLRDLGEDVDSPAFVRNLMEKLPVPVMNFIKPLFINGAQPTTTEILDKYDSYHKDLAFFDRFKPAAASERLKEIPDESVMTVSASSNKSKSSKGNSNSGVSTRTDPSANSSSKKPKVRNNDPPTSNRDGKSKNASKNSKSNNVDNGSPGEAGTGHFGAQPNAHQGNMTPRSYGFAAFGNPPPQTPRGAPNAGNYQGGHPTSTPSTDKPKPRIPGMRGQPGEKLEPCYKLGRGYDERFIHHTFPRDSEIASKCCFICGPGHSILQCALSSYEVRQYFRTTGSCHNCAQQTHRTEDCKNFSTCAYCQGVDSGPFLARIPTVASPATAPLERPSGPDSDKYPLLCRSLPLFLDRLTQESLYNASLVEDCGEISKLPFVALRTTDGHKVLALVDSGASLSVLSHKSAERFGLDILATKTLTISGYSKTTTEQSNIYQISFHTDGKPFSMLIAGAPRLPKTKFVCPRLNAADISYLRDKKIDPRRLSADSSFNGQFIDMILGNDLLSRLLGTSKRLLLPSERFVELTKFAPIIFPPPRSSLPPSDSIGDEIDAFHCESFIGSLMTPADSKDSVDRLHTEISQLWNLENVGIEEPGPIEGKKTEIKDLVAEFEKNIRYTEEGYLLVSLPWNGKQSRLASNRGVAGKRLEQLILSLKRKKNLMQDYDDILKKQLASGIIEMVTPEMDNDTDPLYYIPHRVVVKESSLTTKLRIVLDASSKKGGELSLNDCLDPGPSMLVDLFDILIRSRLSDYLVVGDIEKAFHQVRLVPEDRNCTRFIWLKDITKPPVKGNIVEFRFTRIPFGMTCSPFLLAATIDHYLNAMTDGIAERIRQNIYVDNVMLTSNNKAEIQDLRIDSKKAFNSMNMCLREYITNSQDEMAKFPRDEITSETTVKLLGYHWDSVKDTYTVKLATLLETHPTKRQVASRMAETFDPLGVLAPLFVSFKLLMRDLWSDGIDWKSKVPRSLLNQWEAIRKQFSESSITIPRMLRPSGPFKKSHLLVFSDASKDTYACAVYILYEYDDKPPKVGLLTAKSKIKPSASKTLTIPRLELLAIEIGTRIAMSVETAMTSERPSSVRFFSDAMVALYWILRNEQKKCWVSNRVKAINEACDRLQSLEIPSTFHHCPTDQNPADIATRGMGSEELKNCSLWFRGPDFLTNPPSTWPCRLEGNVNCPSDFRELISSEIIAARKKSDKNSTEKSVNPTEQSVDCSAEKSADIVEKSTDQPEFNALTEALRGMCLLTQCTEQYVSFVPFERSNSLARVVTYTHSTLNCLLKLFKRHVWKSPIMTEFINAKLSSCTPDMGVHTRAIARRLVFIEHYKESASSGQEFPSKLDPVLGVDGLWRAHRRVPSPVLESETYKLILVHKKHRLARLLVMETHLKNVHLPATYLVAALRTRYWIQADKQLADSVIRSCVPCQKVNNKPFEYPFTRTLPRFRTTPSTPFQHVGLDYGGPLNYRLDDGSSIGKAYFLVYTCLVTRATHLELIPDGTTEMYLHGLRNVFSRRGVPTSIYSDNARTFTLGAKILTDDVNQYVPSTSFTSFLALHAIDFRYITPLAPWQGGIYERIVGIVKHQLRKEIGKTLEVFFVLSHVITRVESMLNSRPLTPNPRDLDDLPALRPVDFLLPTVLIDLPTERDGLNHGEEFDPSRNPSLTERRTLDHLAGLDEVLERLWDIWSGAYLAYLKENTYPEKRTTTLQPRVGQLVFIYTEKLARHNWPLGIIETLIYSKTGEIRSATVRCKGKIYERPVNHLIPLEVSSSDDVPALEPVQSGHDSQAPPDPPRIATFPIHSKNRKPNTLKTSVEGKRLLKVQSCSEKLDVADPKKIPDVGVCRSGTPTEGIGLKSNGTEPKLVPLCPTLDACRSGAPKERMVPPAPDSDACRSDTSGEGSWREVPSLEACRSGAPKGRIVPPAPDSDSSEEGSWREVPTLDACRPGASKIRIGLKSSGLEQLPDSGSPRNANSLAFYGTPRSGTARTTESATDMDACRSGAPRKRRRLQSPEYVSIPESGPPRIANSLAFDGKPRSGTAVLSDTGSVMDVGRSGTSKGRIVPPAPDSDACRSGASGEGSWWDVPNLVASRSGASKAKVPPRAPDSDACRSGTSGKGSTRRVPNLDANRHASNNDSAKMYSNPKAPRQRAPANMDDWTESSGSTISHDDDGSTGIGNQCPGISYPMLSSRPDTVDHAKARLPSHRVRPFQPRKAKANLACYACITQEAGTQTPRSVVSPLVPESGPCHTPN
ncbi:hypothetical protein CRE_20080 [Caenorhabditis remanei]|uniref:Integrase catalytic domain-containing protein n=1 Tax=Caenorhabditis remanei TaxID=31234 RepID=E3NKE2_CAERE|nr:hypothetical protein CRE_20080 [Caenorhabditis remanei]